MEMKISRPGTIKDIAKALNLSAGTVSRALSGRGEIAQQTREQVAELAATMEYLPRRNGKGRQMNHVTRVGVCVGNRCVNADGTPDPTYVGLSFLIGLERVATAGNIGVMAGFIDASAPGQRFDQLPVLQRGETQGLILVYPFPEQIVRQLAAQVPTVSIEHVYPSAPLDTVGPAHSLDAMSAVEYLHGLGHRRIGYVSDEDAVGHKLTIGLRHAGFVSGLARSGMAYRAEDVVNVYPPVVAKPQLAAHIAEMVRGGVTAIITSIDRHGYLLWDQLPALGIRIPEDVSLVGIGGIYRSKGLPQLTTWRCNYESIATAAFDALKSRRAGLRTINLYQEIASVFVQGESSAAPR
jgi:LacI family transcriptional regulator